MNKFFAAAIILFILTSCKTIVSNEGFDNSVGSTTTVFIPQGKSCIAALQDLYLAIKYPERLPKGVTAKSIGNKQIMLKARSDAALRIIGFVSSGTRIEITRPSLTLSPNCKTFSMPI